MMDTGLEAIALVSGGLDSCVSLAWALAKGWHVRVLHVTYGQRTSARERRAFEEIADHYGIPAERRLAVSLDYLQRIGGSSLTDPGAPMEDADLERPNIPSTYVPFRNTHLIAIAASWAEVAGCGRIVIGAVADDSSGYPDCRPEYYAAVNDLLAVAAAHGPIEVETPVIGLTKSQIVRLGVSLAAPLHLTWSCYRSEEAACGLCDSCALRLRGFRQAGLDDPIAYRERPAYE